MWLCCVLCVQVPIIDIPGIGDLSAIAACDQFKVYSHLYYYTVDSAIHNDNTLGPNTLVGKLDLHMYNFVEVNIFIELICLVCV